MVAISVVAAVPTQSAPQRVRELPVQLVIPDIYLEAPLMSGIDDAALKQGPGHDVLSDAPGAPGNCVVAAHRNVWGAWFWHLPRVKKGARIELRMAGKIHVYRVIEASIVAGHDTSFLEAPHDPRVSRLTLYTCTKPRTNNRFIVVADRIAVESKPSDASSVPLWMQAQTARKRP